MMYVRRALIATCLFATAVAATAAGASTFRATPHAALAPRGGAAAAATAKAAPKKATGGAKNSKAAASATSKGLLDCLSFDKASIVKAHGMVGLVFLSCWALETFGVPSAPVFGLQSTVKGINLDDPVTKFLVRLCCAFAAGLNLAEIEATTNPYMQKIFLVYQIPFALAAYVGAREFALGRFGYALPSVLGLFVILGIFA